MSTIYFTVLLTKRWFFKVWGTKDILSLLSYFACLTFFIPSYRLNFPTGVISFHHKEHLLAFSVLHLFWQQSLPVVMYLKVSYVFIFEEPFSCIYNSNLIISSFCNSKMFHWFLVSFCFLWKIISQLYNLSTVLMCLFLEFFNYYFLCFGFKPFEYEILRCGFLFFFFCLLGLHPRHVEVSQAKGLMGTVAAGLHQSHSNARSEPCLWTTPQLKAMPDP